MEDAEKSIGGIIICIHPSKHQVLSIKININNICVIKKIADQWGQFDKTITSVAYNGNYKNCFKVRDISLYQFGDDVILRLGLKVLLKVYENFTLFRSFSIAVNQYNTDMR